MRPNHARHTTASRWQPADSQQAQEEGCPWTPRHRDAPRFCTALRGGQRASRRRPKRVDAVCRRKRDVSLPGRRRPPRLGASGPLGSAGRDAPRERRRQPRGDHLRRGASASAWGGAPLQGAVGRVSAPMPNRSAR